MSHETPHGEPCYSPNCPHTIKVVGHTGDDETCRQCGHHIETESDTPEPTFSLHDDLIAAMRILHEIRRSPEEFCLGNRLRMAAEEMEKPVAATSESTQLEDAQFQLRSVVVLDLGYDGHEPAGSTTPLRHMFAWRYGFAGMELEARHAAVNYLKGLAGKARSLPLPEQIESLQKQLTQRNEDLALIRSYCVPTPAQSSLPTILLVAGLAERTGAKSERDFEKKLEFMAQRDGAERELIEVKKELADLKDQLRIL